MALTIPNSFASKTAAQLTDLDANFAYIQTLIPMIMPPGAVIMWSGSIANIPTGWYLCDGTNSTPDLRNKFIVGADADNSTVANTGITGSPTQTGGSKDAVVVSHTHTATVTDAGHSHKLANAGSHKNNSSPYMGIEGTVNVDYALGSDNTTTAPTLMSSSTQTTGVTVANSTTGVSGTNANLPPYFALAYIMKAPY